MKKTLRRIKKVLLVLTGILLFLMLFIYLFFKVPAIQNKVAGKVTKIAGNSLNTEVKLGEILIIPPNKVQVKDLYVQGADGDSLLSAGEISADISLFKLLRKRIEINRFTLSDARVAVRKNAADSTFNFAFNTDTSPREPDTNNKSAWTFDIDEVELNQVNAGFSDELSGNNYKASIGYLNLSLDSLNLEESAFYVEALDFRDADILVDIRQVSDDESDEETALPQFAVSDDIQLENINLRFNNIPSSQWITLEHLNLTVIPEKIDLQNNHLAFEEINLHDSFIKLKNLSQDTASQTNPHNPESEALPWNIAVDAIDFENNSLEYLASEFPKSGKHFSADNIKVSKLSADINNAHFRDGNAGAEIAHCSFREHDHFYLKSFSGVFALTESGVEAEDIRIMTPKSEIAFSFNSEAFNPEQLSNNYAQIPFRLKLKDIGVNYDDVQYFYQDTALTPYREAINQLAVEARFDGAVNDIQIKEFHASIADELTTRIEGHVSGLPEIKKATGRLSIESHFPDDSLLRSFLPDTLLPEKVRIPENLLVEGDISGDYLAAKGEFRLSSQAGELKANLGFQQDTLRQKETFDVTMNADGFDLGGVYPMGDTLGKLFASVKVNGRTSGFEAPVVEAEVDVDTLYFLNYPYAGLYLEGGYANNKYTGDGSINDENIVFSFDGEVDMSDTIPDIKLAFAMPGVDFQALNITEMDFRAGLHLFTDINGNSPDNSNGHITVKDMVLVKQNEHYNLDSLVIRAKNEKELTHLTASSKLFNLDFEGNVKFSDISKSLWSHLNLFFRMDSIPMARPDIPKNFNLNFTVDDHPLIRELFLPHLTTFGGFQLEVAYNEDNSRLDVNSFLAPMAYNGIELDSTHLKISSEEDALQANLISDGIDRQPVFIPELDLNARLVEDVASWSFDIKDIEDKKKYSIAGKVSTDDGVYKSVLNADSMKLNYKQWRIPEDNAILIYKDSIAVRDFHLTSGGQSMKLKQAQRQGQAFTQVIFDGFRLKTLTNMITSADMMDAGVNGTLSFSKADTSLSSEMTINDLNLEGNPLFQKITLDFDRNSRAVTALSATLSQTDGGAEIEGRLVTDENSNSKATISFNTFTLDNFQPFFKEDLKKLYGDIHGEIEVVDPSGDMAVNGNLSFTNAVIAPTMLGTAFGIDGSELTFDKDAVQFNQFTIHDAHDQQATLDGEISSLFSDEITFDIGFEASDYTFIDADEDENDMFYGNLTGDMSAEIYGSTAQPKIEMRTNIEAPSDFNFIVPSTESATVEREGLVVFVKDEADEFNEILEVPEDTTDLEFSPGFDLDMTARISVENEARLTIIVDPASDEQLSIQGTADLNFNMTDGAQQTLTGRYLVNEGKYTLTLYDVVKREFEISDNSSIRWTGDVMDAQADLSAVYQVRTSAEGLIANEVSDMSEEKRQQLRQPYPFLVTLNISGELLKPELDFDISLPRNVSVPEITNKLNQINQNESEVNKQAFSLLVFGSFIQSNVSTSRPISYEINSAARSSISKILSTQLNRLAEKYIKGVDVNLKVDSYADYSGNSTRNTTNVKLNVRKQFFDERLTVKVGGKVNIEGEEQRTNNLQRVAGDVVILYDLTEDGRFKLKGFNTTEYENMFEGELRKTGVGVIYNRDYYHFRNLFQADSIDRRRNETNEDLIVE